MNVEEYEMKELYMGMLLVGGALHQGLLQAFDPKSVEQMKTENMVAFKKSLEGQISSVKMTKYLVYGGLAFGACEGVRRLFFTSDNASVTKKEHDDLQKRVDLLTGDLQNRVTLLEGANPPGEVQTNLMVAEACIKFVGAKLGEWVPSIVKMYAYSQAASIMWRHLPQVDKYIGFNPTINWCMYNGTGFVDSIGEFMNWCRAIGLEPGKHFDQENPEAPLKNLNMKSYAVACHSLVASMEQVLGYMDFVRNRLDPKCEKYEVLKTRSENAMGTIAQQTQELVEMVNGFLREEAITLEVFDAMMQFWQVKMFLIVEQLEAFEPVTIAAGFIERDGKGRFNEIKRFIAPQFAAMKPKAEPTTGLFEGIATDALSEVAQAVL